MIDYDSFSRCHLTDIFFAIHAGAKELKRDREEETCDNCIYRQRSRQCSASHHIPKSELP